MSKSSKHDQPRRIPRPQKPDPEQKFDAAAKLLDEWMLGDEPGQRETFDSPLRSVDEDRPEG